MVILLFQSPDVFFLYFHESEEFVAVNRSDSRHHPHHHLPPHLPPPHHHYCHICKIFSDWFPVGWRGSGTQSLIWATPPCKRNLFPALRLYLSLARISCCLGVLMSGWMMNELMRQNPPSKRNSFPALRSRFLDVWMSMMSWCLDEWWMKWWDKTPPSKRNSYPALRS